MPLSVLNTKNLHSADIRTEKEAFFPIKCETIQRLSTFLTHGEVDSRVRKMKTVKRDKA